MELIRPIKQTVWRWPAVANFTLGGMGTGFYLLGLLVVALYDGDVPQSIAFNAVFKLLGPALASLGFLALTTEAGRPLRGHHLFRHLRRSWMSREALAGAIFIPAAVADWLLPHPALRALATLGAVGLLVSQGFIVYRARGVTAWNVSLMPLFFVTSGLASGGGLVLLPPLNEPALRRGFVAIELILIVLNLMVWFLYLRRSDETFLRATKNLRRPNAVILTIGMGHLLPALLLTLVWVIPDPNAGGGLRVVAAAVAGLAVIVGGVLQKAGIILEAGYLRPIVLGRMVSTNTRICRV